MEQNLLVVQKQVIKRFNTASGRYYCNQSHRIIRCELRLCQVSIPQAVGTIAICAKEKYSNKAEEMFQYRKRQVLLQLIILASSNVKSLTLFQYRKRQVLLQQQLKMSRLLCLPISFNTASGRYYCNTPIGEDSYCATFPVSIPQAVGTIAMPSCLHALGNQMSVSIPQAVGTIAIAQEFMNGGDNE